ncbi:helix-turn-helix transcriptional regulator [Leisingera daeponensis]|uniref:Helix-turn-helix transcriptional regulator n=1 Tax=Leisingera daeponensis TaxID=405746 RepID=A0ABS7NBD1_9RHOB|nr:helix-turn-helix transcriptional regulator [Leisingera daeponensis]MBY6138508.1 helix-turn-helix transcriptional regulator [Leisingera daeponensis]
MTSVWLEQWTDLLGGKCHGLMVLDGTGNLAFLDIVLNGSPACQLVVHWQNIRVSDPLQNAKLSRLIRAGIDYDENSGQPLPPPVKIKISNDKSFYIDLIPLPVAFREKLDGAKSLLSIRQVEDQSDTNADLLKLEFHLTPAEAAVAIQLSKGISLKQAARTLGVSIWTARSHLRSIFQKTNTHRQGELVSLLAHFES